MKTIMGFAIPQDTTSALIESTKLVMKLQVENVRLRDVIASAAEQIRKCDYTPARSTLLVALAKVHNA